MTKIEYMQLFVEMTRNEDTQTSIANLLGISQQAVSRKLSGKNQWRINEIEKLCKYYNKDFCELFKREETQNN